MSKKLVKSLLVLVLVFGLGIIVGQENIVNLRLPGQIKSSQQNSNLPNKLNYNSVEEVYDELKDGFDGQLDQTKLEDGLKEGLAKATGDPYTEYLNEEASKDFEEGLSGSFEGIGAELGKEGEAIVIISPISGFPAEKAGVKAKDIIAEIDGQTAFELSVTEAVKKIRGPKGSKVKLGLVRDGKRIDIEITRDQINIPSVKTEVLENNIGVIEITRFGDDTVQLVNSAAVDFKNKKINKIILDMRGNPGGLLDGAVAVSEIWLPEGSTILQEKREDKVIKTFFARGDALLSGVKTVVLINEGSASASEIVAGALKDNKAAIVIGVKSYGKGSVQEVRNLNFGGSLKVTVARWFTPGGRNIDKEGIEPDQKVELSDADAEAQRDPQKDAAANFLRTN